MAPQPVPIHTPYIALDALLKWAGAAATGGNAKVLVASGQVAVNGATETRRGRKLYPGDVVTLAGVGDWIVAREGG